MTPKAFVYLAVAAVLSVLFAIVSYASNNQWSSGKLAGDKLFPALVSEASQVTSVEIKQGEEAAVLERKGGTWTLKSRDGYPADPVKVRTLLVGLAEADLIEGKTRRADRYGVLELEDPADKGAKSRLVRLLGANGKVIGEVVVGKKRVEMLGTGKGSTYVRRPGDPQTWLASAELDASVAAKDWIKTSVLTLDAANISRVTVEIPGEEPLKIERETTAPPKKDAKDSKEAKDEPAPPAPPGKLKLVGFPPEGKKLKDATAAESLARALASIELEDVRKLAATPGGPGVSTVKVEQTDAPALTLRLRKDGVLQARPHADHGRGDLVGDPRLAGILQIKPDVLELQLGCEAGVVLLVDDAPWELVVGRGVAPGRGVDDVEHGLHGDALAHAEGDRLRAGGKRSCR
jgi:Domain of unknown function (DUF4340)